MANKQTRKLIENYLTLTLWFMAHEEDKDISGDQFSVVLEEIGNIEDQLRMHGLSQLAIDKLLNYVHELYKTPISQLSENAQIRLGKIVSGSGTHWDKTPPTPKQSLGERKK